MLVKFKFSKSKSFFNKKAVARPVRDAAHNVLTKFGAFVRRTARSSVRTRRLSSVPGDPPSSHTGLLRRLIRFAYSVVRKSVVIGPEWARSGGAQLLHSLEEGGPISFRPRRRRGKLRSRRVRTSIQARPFMGPALVENISKLSRMWRDSVKR